MDGDLRLFPLWQTLTGDMLIRPFYPTAPLPHYISLKQLVDYVGGAVVSDTPLVDPGPGALWFDGSKADMLYVYYDNTWVPVVNQPGPVGSAGPVGPAGPTGPGVDYPEQSVLTPTAGQTLDVPSVSKTILNPAAALATLTLRLPDVADKRSLRIATRQRIDALTITALGGQSVDWAVGELPANAALDLTLVQSLNAWVRA